MAIRYDDIEFDTVEELIEYKQKMGGAKLDSPTKQTTNVVNTVVELRKEAVDMQPFMDNFFDGADCLYIVDFYKTNLVGKKLQKGAFEKLARTMRQTPTQIRDKVFQLRKAGIIQGYEKQKRPRAAKRTTGPKVIKPKVSRSYKKQPPLNQNRPWTKRDDTVLTHYYYKWRDSKGKKRIPAKRFKILCRKLRRSPEAVKARLNVLRTNGA